MEKTPYNWLEISLCNNYVIKMLHIQWRNKKYVIGIGAIWLVEILNPWLKLIRLQCSPIYLECWIHNWFQQQWRNCLKQLVHQVLPWPFLKQTKSGYFQAKIFGLILDWSIISRCCNQGIHVHVILLDESRD